MTQSLSAIILDCEGTVLTADEKAFFKDLNPYGYILFARHCESPEGVKRLVSELKSLSGRDRLPVLIDQEGGRVARLKPPHWRKYPPAAVFAGMALTDRERARQAVYMNARLIADDLLSLGITVDCAPLADIPVSGAHDIIGDRAFGNDATRISFLAKAMADGLSDGGVVPVLKHMPGHGRARADSHLELPVVDTPLEELRRTDFIPFKALSHLPMGMTAHVLYTALDGKRMATQSKPVIDLIRRELNFDGLLMSDDISMKAMEGGLAERARLSLDAGCDVVLLCNASLSDRLETAKGIRALEGRSLERAERAMHSVSAPHDFDRASTIAQLEGWLQNIAA